MRQMKKGKYTWVCKSCIIKAGFDPNKITESCLGTFYTPTCCYCGKTGDRSQVMHVSDPNVISKLNGEQNE